MFVGLSKGHYKKHVEPSMQCAQRCGNMYTASLYGSLASLLSTVEPVDIYQGQADRDVCISLSKTYVVNFAT